MSRAAYSLVTPAQTVVGLASGTARSILGVKAHANSSIDVLGLTVGYDGVTASNSPVWTEFCYCTWATNSPGTNSTTLAAPAITQMYGRALTAGFTAAHTWTIEPTVITVLDTQLLTPNGGLIKWAFPLGTEPDCALAEGFLIRCRAGAAVNVTASMIVARN